MNKRISDNTVSRLEKFPKLKRCVGDETNDPLRLDAVTVYVRMMDVDEPDLFDWDDDTAEDFYTWGHNSRYANVFEPMLEENFDEYLNIIMDYVENVYNGKEKFINDKELFED